MKTFFVTVPKGIDIKNFLLGRFYRAAREHPDVRLVVFTEPDRLEACRAAFAHERCLIEPLPDIGKEDSATLRIFRIIFMSSIPSESIWIRQKYALLDGGSYLSFLVKRGLWLLGHLGWWHAAIRWFDWHAVRNDRLWDDYFQQYRPDAVFATNLMLEYDFAMLKAAKRRGIPMLAMMRSWDNPSSKVMLRAFPDHLLLQNHVMVGEVTGWDRYPRERISVIGFPQFDDYVNPEWFVTKEAFAREHGLDPAKRWIVYFTGPFLTGVLNQKDRGDHVEMIQHAIDAGAITNAMIIARIHPNDPVEFKSGLEKIPRLTFGKNFQFNADDVKTLMNLLRHADVAVHAGSTIGLEAAIFDRPIVLLSFNGYHDEAVKFQHRLDICLDHTTHYVEAQTCQGMWRVRNEGELIEAIKSYLERPAMHAEGRKCLRERLITNLDGYAGDRAFAALMKVSE